MTGYPSHEEKMRALQAAEKRMRSEETAEHEWAVKEQAKRTKGNRHQRRSKEKRDRLALART